MDFVKTVNQVIEERNLKKSEVARGSGVSESDIYKILSGKKGCGIKTAEKICEFLNLRLGSFYD